MLSYATRIILAVFLLSQFAIAQSGSVRGKVTDADTGEPLIGANVTIEGTSMGAATDADGIYVITSVPVGSHNVVVAYIGYDSKVISNISVSADESATANARLTAEGIAMNPITISASRRPEKTLEAPASVSVLSDDDVTAEVITTSADVLKNVTGVDMAQTGVDRREIVLRGFNNAFSGATFVLTDYRQSAIPSLAVNIHSVTPNMPIDVDKVEVVRGPGSALYGPGVDAGVVHFITKDPFTHQGTTVSWSVGERSSAYGSFRMAKAYNDEVAFKITGVAAQSDDWELDPNDPVDAVQLNNAVVDRNYVHRKLNLNGMVQLRLQENTTLTFNGGYAVLDGINLSGIGTTGADNFSTSYGQLRLQAGSFFVQGYVNGNNAGDSFVYGTGIPVVDKSLQYNGQMQYDFALGANTQVIVGGDVDATLPSTGGTIYGRNEQDDTIVESGAYLQTTSDIGDKLALTLAARGDYNNIVEDFQISPRVALVFKATPLNTFRVTYNRAFSSPGNNSLFLDIIGQRTVLNPALGYNLDVRGRGARDGFSFSNSALPGGGWRASSTIPIPGLWGAPLDYPGVGQPVQNIPLAAVYGLVYAGIAATPTSQLTALLNANGIPVNDQLTAQVVGLLDPSLTQVPGLATTALGAAPIDVDPLGQTTTQTVEAGYKGLLGGKLLFALDGYWTQKENFVGPLLLETPLAGWVNIDAELAAGLAAGIANNALLAGALQQLGLTPELVAGLVTSLGSENVNALPVGVVQANGNAVPGEAMLTYRNFGKVTYYGLDASAQFLLNDEISLFGNVSWVSDDFFDNEELDETNTDLSLALNAPTLKLKGGFSYAQAQGLFLSASGRFIKGFPVQSGPYVGGRPGDDPTTAPGVDDYFLIDASLGYDLEDLAPGLRLNVSVSNLLDNEHREFIGAPKLGRLARVGVTMDF